MRKIHVITQKEAVNEEKLKGCVAVVIDVFLATSTIAFLLEKKYQPVYAVEDSESALKLARELEGPFVLLGETKGESIEGFQYPDPCLIVPAEKEKTAIICSTNGTRAIKKAENAKVLYISSLINGHAIAKQLHELGDMSSIVLICSGNDDRFSMEDFVGAGQIVHHLGTMGEYILSDSSKLARDTYKNALQEDFQGLLACETADLLRSFDYEISLDFVLEHFEKVDVIPKLDGNKIINQSNTTVRS